MFNDPDWLPLHRRTIDTDKIINEDDERIIVELILQIIEDQDYILSNDLKCHFCCYILLFEARTRLQKTICI